MRAPMTRTLLLVALATACTSPPARVADEVLVAASSSPEAVRIERGTGGVWSPVRRLPADARAVRLSAGGRSVAWVRDVRAGDRLEIHGYAWGPKDAAPRALGPLGFREHEAFGLAIDDEGRSVHLAPDGTLVDSAGGEAPRGQQPIFIAPGRWSFTDETGCAAGACGSVLRLLVAAPRKVWRTNAELLVEGEPRFPITDVHDADARADGRLLVVRRGTREGRTVDELLLPPDRPPLLQARIVISARWAANGTIVAITNDDPGDIYAQLLAHAPEEFDGEQASGRAFRVDPVSGRASPIPGLENRAVRALIVAR